MELLHRSNIILHVVTGSLALLLGLIALLSLKGGSLHIKSGRLFLGCIVIVIFTGLIGVFVFGRNTFLLVITILSGYVAFSGYRTLQFKSNLPKTIDVVVALMSIIVLTYFLFYFRSIGMIWSPIVIYSTVGAFIFVVLYDFLRYIIPKKKYVENRIWLYEHIYKMTSAFAALLSAFAGTIFEAYQPHSQYVPSVLGFLIIIGYFIYVNKFGLKGSQIK